MKLATQVRTLFLVLVAIQVLTSLAGIALLGRMSPAIGRVLVDNEASVEAAEQMLSALTATPAETGARATFEHHLRTAEENITEAEERPALAILQARGSEALDGDPLARRDVASALLDLSRVNRAAMHRADEDARRLGLAGRWALALMALLGLLASALAMRRARQKLLAPVTELVSVVSARRGGDLHRRYLHEQESELSRVFIAINELMDAVDREPSGAADDEMPELRSATSLLLDRLGGPLILVGREGKILAASLQALELLAAHGEHVRRELREGDGDGWTLARDVIAGTSLSLVTLREPVDSP